MLIILQSLLISNSPVSHRGQYILTFIYVYIYIYNMYRKRSENGIVVYRYKTEGTSLAAYSNHINCMYHIVSSSVTTHDVGLAHASQPLALDVSFPQPLTQDVPHQNTVHACQC